MGDSLDSILDNALAGCASVSSRDTLVIALHSCLLSEGFVCVAIGDERFGGEYNRTLPAISTSSNPQLPSSWNSSQDVYALQYRHKRSREMCLVKVVTLGEQLLFNAVRAGKSDEVYSVTLDVSKYVRHGAVLTTTSVFNNLLQLITILSKEIESKLTQACEKAMPVSSTDAATVEQARVSQPDTTSRDDGDDDDDNGGHGKGRRDRGGDIGGNDPLRVDPPRQPRAPIRDPDPLAGPGLPGYGDGDRLPFGGSGGMVFDPLRQGGRMGGGVPGFGPQGPFPPSHPLGARFDPVSPFGPRPMPHPPGRSGGPGFYGPDPDHLPPPGYDDMFS